MKLIDLSTGYKTLEFSDEEFPVVRDFIRKRFGFYEIDKTSGFTVLRFSGESFLSDNDCGEGCLISNSEPGNKILDVIFDHLG